MLPQVSTKIDFRKQRDFSAIFTDGFKFFKRNLKIMIPAILILIGPVAVAVSGIQGYLQSQGIAAFTFFNLHTLPYYITGQETSYYLNILQLILTNLISIVSMALIGRFFILYQEKDISDPITINDILSNIGKDFFRVFLNYILLLLFSAILGLIIFGIFQIPVLNWILGVSGFIILLPNIYYCVSIGFYLVIRDRILFPEAVKKTMHYMRGNYWWTWVNSVVSLFIVGMIGLIFTLPYLIFVMIETFTRTAQIAQGGEEHAGNPLVYIILAIIAGLGAHLISPLYNIFNTLLFHSQEEAEDGTGLKSKIEEIGLNN